MSYETLEVRLDHGQINVQGSDSLPKHGHGSLTILSRNSNEEGSPRTSLKDLQPSSVGKVLRAYPDPDDVILDEMRTEEE